MIIMMVMKRGRGACGEDNEWLSSYLANSTKE